MRLICGTVAALALALCVAACGGSGGGYNSSPSPTPTPTPTGNTVSIVGQKGNKSFTPNPSTASADGKVVFSNNDGTTHHIVANDNSWDTGNLAAGASSASITIPAGGSNFHCTIHPTMVGVVNASDGNTPPCVGAYC